MDTRVILGLAIIGILVLLSGPFVSASDSSEEDKARNYTCTIGEGEDDDCEPHSYFDGIRYCCDDYDHSIWLSIDYTLAEATHSNSQGEPLNTIIKKSIKSAINCKCIDDGEGWTDKVKDALSDAKDKAKDVWEDAKDWLDDKL